MELIFLVEHARADKGARQGPCDGVEVQGRSGVEREYLEYTIYGRHMQRVLVMQNAEFHFFLSIFCHKYFFIYMLVNKE